MTVKELMKHNFASIATKDAFHIVDIAGDRDLFKSKAGFDRELNEYEYYLVGVGTCIAHLISFCQQLQDSVLYISSFSPTPRMKKSGITKYSYLYYNIENYIIRTQSLNDRILFLIDSVYHLCINPETITYKEILDHPLIAGSEIEIPLKTLKKLLKKYQYTRNSIIHHGSYQEEDLRKLEGYTLLINDENNRLQTDDPILSKNLPNLAKELSRNIVNNNMKEFLGYNELLFKCLSDMFDILFIKYEEMKGKLS